MKLRHTTFWLAAITLISSCGVRQDASSIKGFSGSDPLASIGRGAKLTLIKDVEVSPNSQNVRFEPLTSEYAEGRPNHTWQTYLVCAIYLRESSLDRRVLKAGTVIELNGEARKFVNGDPARAWEIEALGIASPSALTDIGCVKLAKLCYRGFCDPYEQRPVKMQDLEVALTNVAKVQRPDPVVIPPN